jgi:hypothetical protein
MWKGTEGKLFRSYVDTGIVLRKITIESDEEGSSMASFRYYLVNIPDNRI